MRRSPQQRRSPDARRPPRAEPPSAGEAGEGYTTREVAEILGLPTSRILAWTRAGLLSPERGARGAYLYSFQDIVWLRAARGLLEAEVPTRRIKTALERLRAQLPLGRPLSAVHLSAADGRILVRDDDRVWEPDTGQLRIELDPSPRQGGPAQMLRRAAIPGSAVASEAPEPSTADDWYDAGVDLEGVAQDRAADAYRRALALEESHPDAHLNLGRLLHEEGKLEEAEGHYRAAADADPEGARAHYNLGVVLEDQGREVEAFSEYTKAVDLDDDLALAHFNLSRLHEARGDEAPALSHLAAYKRLLGRGDADV